MRDILIASGLAFLALSGTAHARCMDYEAFAYEGRVESVRAVTVADIPASPRVDAASAHAVLRRRPMVFVELAVERQRRVATCEHLSDCTPAARAWVKSVSDSRFLAYGLPGDWEEKIGETGRFFAPRACCDVRPAQGPACALQLKVILPTPDDLFELVHDAPRPASGGAEAPEAVAEPAAPDAPEDSGRLERARALYELGPAHASEVIELMRLELNERPDRGEARRLLAITRFGPRQFEEALLELDTVLAAEAVRGFMSPRLQLLKARALEALGRDDEAREVLGAFGGSWIGPDGELVPDAAALRDRLAGRDVALERGDGHFLQELVKAFSADGSLVGALAVVIRSPEFARLEADSDLAVAIASAREHGDEVITLLFQDDSARVAFFRDGRLQACSRDGGAHREPPPVPGGAVPDLYLEPGALRADDGTPISSYQVRPAGDAPGP
jgi:hypothetical protein